MLLDSDGPAYHFGTPGFPMRNIHHRDTEFAEFGAILIKEILTLRPPRLRGAISDSLQRNSAGQARHMKARRTIILKSRQKQDLLQVASPKQIREITVYYSRLLS
jgi:hypothetical protein